MEKQQSKVPDCTKTEPNEELLYFLFQKKHLHVLLILNISDLIQGDKIICISEKEGKPRNYFEVLEVSDDEFCTPREMGTSQSKTQNYLQNIFTLGKEKTPFVMIEEDK